MESGGKRWSAWDLRMRMFPVLCFSDRHATVAGSLVHHSFELLLLVLELLLTGHSVLVRPVQGFLDGLQLLLECFTYGEAIVLEAVLRLDFLAIGLLLSTEVICLLHHAIDFCLGQATILISDGELVRLASALVLGGDVQDAVGVDVEGHLDLGDAARSGRDAIEVKLA
mmetsp:Transcript_43450/g.65833  ORF Transcript_43450/g.65833 Transcript_43450/m.65833 type:complete len:169 (+) Transcript_43450:283-789(+)